MSLLDLLRRRSFSHGIHPVYHKGATAALPIRRLPFPELLVVPLSQHIGKPSIPVVKKGEEVVRGQPIAEADGFVSVPLHAPATGRVRDIELMPTARGPKAPAIILEVFGGSTQGVRWSHPREPANMTPRELIRAVQDTGLVGLGGAAFPSHVKLSIPAEHTVDTLVVNGCECEPYLTCDHRVMLEYTDHLIRGVRIAMQATDAKRAIIGVEDNKMDAVAAIRAKLTDDGSIRVKAVEAKYPQGSEKMLIRSVLGKEVPNGSIPAQVGVVVHNVGTLAALGGLLPRGEGLIERVITVTGPGVSRPGNYLVPLGTPIGFLLQQMGCCESGRNEFVLGGPMMGPAVSSLETPITKGTSGLLVLDEPELAAQAPPHVWPCIKCARCVDACPMHLNPSQLGQLAAKRAYDLMANRYHLNDCFECGCCSYVCPSNIPLVQYFRIAKAINREKAA